MSKSKSTANPANSATRFSWAKPFFYLVLLTLAGVFSYIFYVSYQDYVHPKNAYGTWIEVGAPGYNRERLVLSENGVHKNSRLIATQFRFDGERVYVQTGKGESVYELSGTFDSPQLKRIVPNSPTQRFVKSGYEDTVNLEGGGAAKNRRAALAEHFNED